MDFKKICRRKEYCDISGDIAWFMNNRRWHSLVIPKGTGKTTLLSMLYYFFDADVDSYELFKDAVVSREWEAWRDYLNKRVTIALDFSDFREKDMNSAMQYVRLKMLRLYKEKLHHILKMDGYTIESYMEILLSLEEYESNRSADVKEVRHVIGEPARRQNLKDSLCRILDCFYHGEYSEENAVLLIDNICRLEQVARENGYYTEMYDFLKSYLVFEPDKKCCIYVQVWDADSDRTKHRAEFFCYDPSFLPHDDDMYWRPGRKAIRYQNKSFKAQIRENVRMNARKLDYMILKGQIIMLENQNEQLHSVHAYKERRVERYAKQLNEEIPRYSDNMGLRYMRHLRRDNKYEEFNQLVKNLYVKSRDLKTYRELYVMMQSVNCDTRTDWDEKAYAELEEQCNGLKDNWRVSRHSRSDYWYQIDIGDGKRSCSISDIKVYVTTTGTAIKELYIGAAKEMIIHGNDGFTSMVSSVERDGTICFFVSHRDFYVLEKYLQQHTDKLKMGNPFIAHRGLLGISRDLMDSYSHNAQQARMLWDYFQLVRCEEDVDIEGMYQMFVLGWNAELAENEPFRRHFENSTAQMFVLFMDSLDVLLGYREISDDTLLLSDDRELWKELGCARCWEDVNRIHRCRI